MKIAMLFLFMSYFSFSAINSIPVFSDKNTAHQIITTEIKVKGNCSMCKKRIETAALYENGVKAATWDKETKLLTIIHKTSKVDWISFKKAISDAGHDTDELKTPLLVYEKLPHCCKYRDSNAKTH